MSFNPYSPNDIKNILKSNKLWLSKKRGQNYLIDRNVASKIVSYIPFSEVVLEVGSGLGALTMPISLTNKIYSIEIDSGIYNILNSNFKNENLTLINEDFLRFDINTIIESSLFFVSNMPYSIAGEILKKVSLIEKIKECLIMVQKEFYDRMIAKPKDDNYGVFSILSQIGFKIDKLFSVNRNSFFPIPEVDSCVIKLDKKNLSIDFTEFENFLRKVFSSKRKSILNNIKINKLNLDIFNAIGIDLNKRAEEYDPDEWIQFYINYKEKYKE